VVASPSNCTTPRPGPALGLPVLCLAAVLSGCATGYQPAVFEAATLQTQRVLQHADGVRVTAAVPSAEQTRLIFGKALYDRGIQPVWIEVENRSGERLRFAPVSIDPDYFSPHEVAYIHKSGLSSGGRAAMEAHYYALSMPRQVYDGQTESGFVFTNASNGTKSFNIDLFGARDDHHFSFFVDVPGFTPDHATVDFAALYADAQALDGPALRRQLAQFPCCATDADDAVAGPPVNVAIVARGEYLLRALLRSGWQETPAGDAEDRAGDAGYLFGRPPDATFRIRRNDKRDRNELTLWLSPWQLDGTPVWLARVDQLIAPASQLKEWISGLRVDPDVDGSRDFLLQNLWYGQSLGKVGWVRTPHAVPYDADIVAGEGQTDYFTDGYRLVIWIYADPVSQDETQRADWDEPLP
jgi:hypothetical protein